MTTAIQRRNAKIYRHSAPLSLTCFDDAEISYVARVVETPASQLCGLQNAGTYTLVITPLALRLTDNAGHVVNKLTWPYK